MANASTTTLLDSLGQSWLLEPDQREEVARSLQPRWPDHSALADELVRRGWLTRYQADQLLQGKSQELLLGSYVLLEPLGEGGMGQVFKARNWKLGRVVAVKLIRPERLSNPDAVRRFEREVRAAAALSHPNIVHAHDADNVAGTHLLVMEHVEGTDLARLVKMNGPLPVPQACEYVRQAALALQHAHERGMVHRDIKPANLLVTRDGATVKLLDLGLARLAQPLDDDEGSSTMTQEGVVMGTPDYIAPEQALASHTVDIRADLYSLGCTLYYVLTGKVPFPGGTFTEKLLHHQMHEPRPVEQLRPDVPPSVAKVVRKLMAKRPDDRFQTPAEAAAALAAATTPGGWEDRTAIVGGQAASSPFAELQSKLVEVAAAPNGSREKGNARLLYAIGGGTLLLGGLVAVLLLTLNRPVVTDRPSNQQASPAIVPPNPKRAPVQGDADAPGKAAATTANEQVKAVAAKLVERNPGFDGKVTARIEDGEVVELDFLTNHVSDISPVRSLAGLRKLVCRGSSWKEKGQLTDLSPLRGMKLHMLCCDNNPLTDLAPLQGMPLHTLLCFDTLVSDLSPLKDMKLQILECQTTRVADLSPLKDMHLQRLYCDRTAVSDLSPLKGMKLESLRCDRTGVADLSPLAGMPLKEIVCDIRSERDARILRGIRTLRTINGQTAWAFRKEAGDRQKSFGAWCKEVAALPAEQQGNAVADKLKELNPGFDGKAWPTVEAGVVTALRFPTDEITDISPVQALPGLRALYCAGSEAGQGKLTDLSPLKGMQLTELGFYRTQVADLAPLRNMPLKTLYCGKTAISDLSPLKGMKLHWLHCHDTNIADLSPLKGMPLEDLRCKVNPWRDTEILRSLATLKTINGKPAAEFWKTMDARQKAFEAWCKEVAALPARKQVQAVAARLKELNPGFSGKVVPALEEGVVTGLRFSANEVTDISPVRALPTLRTLYCWGSDGKGKLADLSPLKGMKLTELSCYRTEVADLAPLGDMPLTILICSSTPVSDLAPLVGMKLTKLHCYGTKVSDLSPLKGMPLKLLGCDFIPQRDAEILRSIKTLETINSTPAPEFWKTLETRQAAFEAWCKEVAALPAEKQVQAVADKLKELNPGFDGQVLQKKIEDGVVTVLTLPVNNVTDISPVRALPGLQSLHCQGTSPQKPGRLSDLTPLKGMKLTSLRCQITRVSDLAPLEGMKLHSLHCGGSPVADLAPLRGMPLSRLLLGWTPVSDLSPLKGMALTELDISHTRVTDLSPLEGMPLKNLRGNFNPRDREVLRSIKTLETINGQPAAEFWKQIEAK